MDFAFESRMLALWPSEFIHWFMTACAVELPVAIFSAVILELAVKHSWPVGRSWSQQMDVSAARCMATSSSSLSMVRAERPCLARSWFTRSSTW